MKQTTISWLAILLLFGCAKEALKETPVIQPQEQKELTQYLAPYEVDEVMLRSSCYWIEIPAGSMNALAGAIEEACEGGVIYLLAGMHTLTTDLVITKAVKIIGQAGAVLSIESSLMEVTGSGNLTLAPDIHVFNAPGTLIQDLSIQTIGGDGGTAILLENSPFSAVMRCSIKDYQISVALERSDFVTAMFNTIVVNDGWINGEFGDAYGVMVINGKSAYVADNEISNALFGIWACDKYGTTERNNTHDNLIGQILCNVPPYIGLPSGQITGSNSPGSFWKIRNNSSSDNSWTGYLVIDGANNNLLENNQAFNNGQYDIEMTTDTDRFGLLAPAAYENTVNAGSFSDIRIKNCGPGNTVNGGQLVDNAAEPCD